MYFAFVQDQNLDRESCAFTRITKMKVMFWLFKNFMQSFWFHLKPKLYASYIFQQINFGPQSWKFGGSPSWSCGLWFSCSNIKLGDGRRGHGVYFNEFMFKHITRGIFEISLQHLGRIEEPPSWFWKPLKGRTGLTITKINLGDFKAIYKY